MPKRIIYEKNGQLNIVAPSPSFLAEGGTLQEIIDNDVPEGILSQIIDTSNTLSDETFRNAWKAGAGKVEVDMPKARVIHMGRIRVERDKKLDQLDVDSIRNIEAGLDNTQVLADKQTLRDIPATFDLEQFTTPQVLKAAWPNGVPR